MVVCHCFAVNDRTICGAISAGARTPDDVADRCDAGTGCGGCTDTIRDLLERRGGRVERELLSA